MPHVPADAPARIRVVDDDEASLLAAEALLHDLGNPIVTARSGPEALRAVLRDGFAAILLGVRMPGMGGCETAELVRQRERSRHVPIIFLSGVAKDAAQQFRDYAAGAMDYVLNRPGRSSCARRWRSSPNCSSSASRCAAPPRPSACCWPRTSPCAFHAAHVLARRVPRRVQLNRLIR